MTRPEDEAGSSGRPERKDGGASRSGRPATGGRSAAGSARPSGGGSATVGRRGSRPHVVGASIGFRTAARRRSDAAPSPSGPERGDREPSVAVSWQPSAAPAGTGPTRAGARSRGLQFGRSAEGEPTVVPGPDRWERAAAGVAGTSRAHEQRATGLRTAGPQLAEPDGRGRGPGVGLRPAARGSPAAGPGAAAGRRRRARA